MRKYIITKALRCIDEVYPDDNDANGPHFPLEEFIDEAGRRVLLAAPLHVIPNRAALTTIFSNSHACVWRAGSVRCWRRFRKNIPPPDVSITP